MLQNLSRDLKAVSIPMQELKHTNTKKKKLVFRVFLSCFLFQRRTKYLSISCTRCDHNRSGSLLYRWHRMGLTRLGPNLGERQERPWNRDLFIFQKKYLSEAELSVSALCTEWPHYTLCSVLIHFIHYASMPNSTQQKLLLIRAECLEIKRRKWTLEPGL